MNRRTFSFVTLIIFFALLPRIIILINSSITFYSDDAIYAQLARFFLKGDFYHAFHPTWPPLFPFVSSFFYRVFANWEFTLRLVSVISGVSLIIPFYLLVSKTISKIHALFFCIPLSFFSPIFNASITPLSDMLAAVLIISCIVSIFIGLQTDNRKLFLLGAALAGLTFLTRSEGTMFFGLSLIYLLIYLAFKTFRKTSSLQHNFLTAFLFTGVFLTTISPYAIAIHEQLGFWTLSQKFSAQIQQEHVFKIRERQTTWAQEITSIKSPNYHSPYFTNGQSYVLKNITWFIELFFQKLQGWKNVLLKNLPVWSLVFILIGLFSLFRKHFFWSTGYLVLIFTTAIPITIFSTAIWDIRYLLWTFPFLLYLFYKGVYFSIMLLFCNLKIKILSCTVPVLVLLALLTLPSFSFTPLLRPISYAHQITSSNYKEEIKIVSSWITNHTTNPNPKIMARHEAFEFYTGGETIYLPQELSYSQLLEYAKKYQVDYIVIWSEEIAEKQLIALLNPSAKTPGLTREFNYPEKNPTIVVYTITN